MKIVDPDSAEESAIQALSAIPHADSYIIPAVFIDCTRTHIIKMPYLALESWFRSDFALYRAYLKVLVEVRWFEAQLSTRTYQSPQLRVWA